LKKCKKKDNTWKIKKQNFKTEKKQNNWEKMESQKGKKEEHGFVSICIFFAFMLLSRLVFSPFYFAFFCFLPGKKQNKSKKTNRKSKINANKMQMDKSIFSPFFPLFDLLFFFTFFPL
jgi:hypothetical protein